MVTQLCNCVDFLVFISLLSEVDFSYRSDLQNWSVRWDVLRFCRNHAPPSAAKDYLSKWSFGTFSNMPKNTVCGSTRDLNARQIDLTRKVTCLTFHMQFLGIIYKKKLFLAIREPLHTLIQQLEKWSKKVHYKRLKFLWLHKICRSCPPLSCRTVSGGTISANFVQP